MKALLLTLLCIGPLTLLAQENRYDVALSYGLYGAPKLERDLYGDRRVIFLEKAQPKGFLAAEFAYHLTNRWVITSGFVEGHFRYFDNIRTAVFPEPSAEPKATNGSGYESHLYLTASYSIRFVDKLSLEMGTGLGMYHRTLKYPYRGPGSTDDRVFTSEESLRRLELPLNVKVYYLIKNRIGVGIKAGAFLLANGSLVSAHLGPQIRLRL